MLSVIFILCVVSTFAALPDLNFKKCGFKNEVYGDQRLIAKHGGPVQSEYPWNVAVYRQYRASDVPQFICAGSIVHPRIVLTTAHCVYNEEIVSDILTVVAGKYYLSWTQRNPIEQRRKVTELFIPPTYVGFKNRYADDIALLALNDSLVISSAIMPVCLDWELKFNLSEPKRYGTVVGWGLKADGSIGSELQVEALKYYDFVICRDKVSEQFSHFITSDKFCAASDNYSRTVGGAAFTFPQNTKGNKHQHYLYGVASVREKMADTVAFTDIRAHLAWLNKTLLSILA